MGNKTIKLINFVTKTDHIVKSLYKELEILQTKSAEDLKTYDFTPNRETNPMVDIMHTDKTDKEEKEKTNFNRASFQEQEMQDQKIIEEDEKKIHQIQEEEKLL